MIIDGHSHLTLPVEEHIKSMDNSGVDKTVLFSTSFHPEMAANAQEVKDSMQYLHDLLSGKKGNMTEIRKKSIEELVKEIPNLFLDTSAYYSTFVLRTVINELPENCL